MNKLVLLLMFLLLPLYMLAQQQDPFEEALFQKLQMSKNQQASYELSGQDQMRMHQIDRSLITKLRNQNGGNTATVIQTGNDNRANVSQQGTNHQADITMEGSHLNYDLSQTGDGNVVDETITGAKSAKEVRQFGQGNVLSSQLRGNGLKHEIHQQGKANTLVQTGFQSVPLIIRQRGVGMQVRINGR